MPGHNEAPARVTLFSAGSTAAAQSQAVPIQGVAVLTVNLKGTGTIAAGTLVIEEASWNPQAGETVYTGTWSQIQSIDLSGVTGGIAQSVHVPTSAPGAYAYDYVRGRISVAVTGGGSVEVILTVGR